jgi:hypothetical protein
MSGTGRTRALIALTNNPAVNADKLHCEVLSVVGTPLDVLDRAEELLQEHCKLLTSPLPPNVPLIRAPYRTLILEKDCTKQYDAAGIISISKARERYKMERAIGKSKVSSDYADLDLDFTIRALANIDAYH